MYSFSFSRGGMGINRKQTWWETGQGFMKLARLERF